jgi:hypothetical protein
MRVRVWNAYASNNSGSYTIVGILPSEEVARETAEELAAMVAAHTAWLDARQSNAEDSSLSPLAEFCRKHGLTWSKGRGTWDDWPEHSSDNRPRVAAFGMQVIVHHDYTVSLPPTFGEFFYKQGGRVEHEENHAHHPIVAVATFWWGWTAEAKAKGDEQCPRLVAALTADDGILANGSPSPWPSAWQVGGDQFGESPLTVGAIFDDVVDGVAALHSAGGAHGAKMLVRLYEAPDQQHDPLAHLRPSRPAPSVARFDVVVTHAGDNRAVLVTAICNSLGGYERDWRERLMAPPLTVGRSLPEPSAEAIAGILRKAGATVDVIRNDG